MARKKIDNRLRVMIETGVATGHRTMFAIVGDKAKEQVVILHHICGFVDAELRIK